jgi:hypothetical protein
MTFPLTPTVIVLGLSPADSDACTGTARPINRSNLKCRPFMPRRLTQLRISVAPHHAMMRYREVLRHPRECASAPNPKFASEGAAKICEVRNRDTRGPPCGPMASRAANAKRSRAMDVRHHPGDPRWCAGRPKSGQPDARWIKATSPVVDATSPLECRRLAPRGKLTSHDRGRTCRCGATFGSGAQAGWLGCEAPGSRPPTGRAKCDPYASLDRQDPCADRFCGSARARERKRIFCRWIE